MPENRPIEPDEPLDENNTDACIFRSPIDGRVWVPCMEGGFAVVENEACSSTSLRRVKAYIEEKMGEGTWTYLAKRKTWLFVVEGNGKWDA